MKMVNETKKIFNKDIELNATCVRVPVLRGHSESIYIETKKPIDMDKVFELLENSTGIDLCDDLANQVYPMPTSFIGDELTHVGRVRKDLYKDKVEFMLYDEKYYEKIISDKELDLKRIGKLKSIKDKDLKDISNYLIKYKKAAYQELLIDEYKQYIRQQVKG